LSVSDFLVFSSEIDVPFRSISPAAADGIRVFEVSHPLALKKANHACSHDMLFYLGMRCLDLCFLDLIIIVPFGWTGNLVAFSGYLF
jgi:hypothetical protein